MFPHRVVGSPVPDGELEYTAARRWFSNRLRDAYARTLGVGKGGQVHHAIELQALRRYPGVFRPQELNAIQNMRGIPGELDPAVFAAKQASFVADLRRRGVAPGSPAWVQAVQGWSAGLRAGDMRRRQLHNSYIRTWWDGQYRTLDAALAARGLRPGAPAYADTVRRHMDAGRAGLDSMVRGLFGEDRKAMDWTQMRQGVKDAATIGLIDPATGRVRPRR
jgi:hypothetical protein